MTEQIWKARISLSAEREHAQAQAEDDYKAMLIALVADFDVEESVVEETCRDAGVDVEQFATDLREAFANQ